ncbi:LysR family transcriptional regulator [Pseudomonas trivialis]|uniref:LysR family transcriptional regulator n=1 Tax=Pseudomonas trivialis TaxID=200450 RepID=UPI0030CBA491
MTRRFDHLADVEVFITVVDKGTVSAGAVSLGTTPTVVSRAIKRLETRLGVQLLRLTTRRLSVTEAGRLYLEKMRDAFSQITDVERSLQSSDGQLSGCLRLGVPTTYGHYRLPPLLAQFSQLHPTVQVELCLTNRNVDLVAEHFDLAIRVGDLPDSGLVGRPLEKARLCLVAAPGYLQRAGAPHTLEDLKTHTCLSFVVPSSGRIRPWALMHNGQPLEWTPQGNVRVAEDVLGLVSLARSGMGICQSYAFIVREYIQNGQLVEVLGHTAGCARTFSIIYPPHQQLPATSRALVEFLVKHAPH